MKKKLKLLHIVEAMGGGVFTYITDMANQMVDVFDVYILYAVRPQTPSDYLEYFDKRIKLIKSNNLSREISLKKDLNAFKEILDIEKEISPDIIHLHSSKAGVLGRWALFNKKVPIFYTPHGYSFLMKDVGWSKRLLYKFVEKTAVKKNCKIIACSEGEYKETLALTNNATYIDNGINIDILEKLLERVQLQEHTFKVFTLGRICYQKNPQLFNEIALRLPKIQFIWIGDGELRDYLTAPNIEVTGWVDRNTALTYSANADVFMLTSLWEGLPISLLEAMYMKKVCIVSDVIGNHDVITSKKNGFVCDSIDEFVEAIELCKNEAMDQLIDRAHQDILERYNTSIMVDKYKRIYSEAVGK